MVDKISYVPSDYKTPKTPEVGVSAYVDPGLDWSALIKTVGGAYGQHKTSQFMTEQDKEAAKLKSEHAIDPKIQDLSTIRSVMAKQEAGAATAEDMKMLDGVMKTYGNLKAAVEQGRQSQKGFELRAQALLRESIKRRPDLVQELNQKYSEAVGTPNLEMLQHRYFAEDLDWVGKAADAKAGPSASDFSRQLDDHLQLARVQGTATARDAMNATALQANRHFLNTGDAAGAIAILAGDTTAGPQSSVESYKDITKATAEIPSKLEAFANLTFNFAPNSPEWNQKMDAARYFITLYDAEDEQLSALINNPMAEQKIKQNAVYRQRLQGILEVADDPQKAHALLQAQATFGKYDLSPEVETYVTSALKDLPADRHTEIGQSFINGTQARQNGGSIPYGAPVTRPATLGIFAGQLARNPKGEKLSDSEKYGFDMLLAGQLADWGSNRVDKAGSVVARSLGDFTDPNQGVLSSVATMIPALNQTYMTREFAINNPVAFARNIKHLAGILDQANRSAWKQLESEGLSQYVRRNSFVAGLAQERLIDAGRGIEVTGKPSAPERQRIDEIVGGLNRQARPIGDAVNNFAKLLQSTEKGK